MQHLAKADDQALNVGSETTANSGAIDGPIRAIRMHIVSGGTSPVFWKYGVGSAPTAASTTGALQEVLSDGLRAIEIPAAVKAGETVYFSWFTAAAATVYWSLVR